MFFGDLDKHLRQLKRCSVLSQESKSQLHLWLAEHHTIEQHLLHLSALRNRKHWNSNLETIQKTHHEQSQEEHHLVKNKRESNQSQVILIKENTYDYNQLLLHICIKKAKRYKVRALSPLSVCHGLLDLWASVWPANSWIRTTQQSKTVEVGIVGLLRRKLTWQAYFFLETYTTQIEKQK